MFKKIIVTEKKYYTYTLAYPEEMGGYVFYVGKGTGDRMLDHEAEARRGGRGRKYDAIREIKAKGYKVQRRIVYETDVEQDALIYEWAGINMIWASPHLTNAKYNIYNHELIEQKRKQSQMGVVRVQIEPGIYVMCAPWLVEEVKRSHRLIDEDE